MLLGIVQLRLSVSRLVYSVAQWADAAGIVIVPQTTGRAVAAVSLVQDNRSPPLTEGPCTGGGVSRASSLEGSKTYTSECGPFTGQEGPGTSVHDALWFGLDSLTRLRQVYLVQDKEVLRRAFHWRGRIQSFLSRGFKDLDLGV